MSVENPFNNQIPTPKVKPEAEIDPGIAKALEEAETVEFLDPTAPPEKPPVMIQPDELDRIAQEALDPEDRK